MAALGSSARNALTLATLWDHLTDDGSRYSLWCAQAWVDLPAGDAFSLTMYLDSRTGQPLMASAVLYPQEAPLLGLEDMAIRLKLGYDMNTVRIESDDAGQKVTLPLEGGFALVKTIGADGSRFTIRLIAPQ